MHNREVNQVLSTLKGMRDDSASEFKKLFEEAAKLGQQLNGDQFELSTPRIAGRQAHRSNPTTSTPEEYYRITMFEEFLSHIVTQLQDRFVDNPAQSIVLGLLYLLPKECVQVSSIPIELARTAEFYEDDLPHPVMLSTEYATWTVKWKQSKADIPEKLVDVLKACSKIQFPNLHTLLQIALTLPITSCESERSYSQLKLIKTSHRFPMGNSRLSGLALMKINRDLCNTLATREKITKLVKSFCQLHPRRMKLPFLFTE